ncbi:MAG: FKBP-type peptidyl-prolyl cis-trans isomerase [Ignavibacteria bacterium]|jgi:FKBP-type peptidyl-prolyl cis-trans isomerase FklB|nr:FKBP-type peptidyl-prolyl cis-trans isomerase [Ignavibacteria bacterium]
MKLLKLSILLAAIVLVQNVQAAPRELKTEKDSMSYALGSMYGNSLMENGVTEFLDVEMFYQAMAAALAGETTLLDKATEGICMQKLQEKVGAKQQAEMAKISAETKAIGTKFLEENKKKAGVTTTASGLQYSVTQEGTGKSPKATDKVTVHYTGRLIDGKVFDSSVERGQPIDFPLNGVIAGWTEGLQLMKEGAKYTFYIPSELAYGDRQQGPDIKPGSTLIFDVELIKVGE